MYNATRIEEMINKFKEQLVVANYNEDIISEVIQEITKIGNEQLKKWFPDEVIHFSINSQTFTNNETCLDFDWEVETNMIQGQVEEMLVFPFELTDVEELEDDRYKMRISINSYYRSKRGDLK